MPIDKLYAQLPCRALDDSVAWFTRLFGRPPDARPMEGLAEWHHAGCAGLQLYEDPPKAGNGTLTLIVTGLDAERARVAAGGLDPSPLQPASTTTLLLLRDPDRNLVVLAEPRGA
jgi:hypothetical protein